MLLYYSIYYTIILAYAFYMLHDLRYARRGGKWVAVHFSILFSKFVRISSTTDFSNILKSLILGKIKLKTLRTRTLVHRQFGHALGARIYRPEQLVIPASVEESGY